MLVYERHERGRSDRRHNLRSKRMQSQNNLQHQIDEFQNVLIKSLNKNKKKKVKRRSGPKEKVPLGPSIQSRKSVFDLSRISEQRAI